LHNFCSNGQGRSVRKGFEANLLPYQHFRFVSLPEFTLGEVPCIPQNYKKPPFEALQGGLPLPVFATGE
jgi:hypothetical protein